MRCSAPASVQGPDSELNLADVIPAGRGWAKPKFESVAVPAGRASVERGVFRHCILPKMHGPHHHTAMQQWQVLWNTLSGRTSGSDHSSRDS